MGPLKIVHRPQNMPARCIASGFSDGPFLDFGTESPFIEPWVYMNVNVLKEAARFVGMVERQELEETARERDELQAEVERLTEELHEQDTLMQGVDGLTRQGFVVRKAPGRPKKKVA